MPVPLPGLGPHEHAEPQEERRRRRRRRRLFSRLQELSGREKEVSQATRILETGKPICWIAVAGLAARDQGDLERSWSATEEAE